MLELNYRTVPTSRTDTLARVLDCGSDNHGSLYGIYEPNLKVDEQCLNLEPYYKCDQCKSSINVHSASGTRFEMHGGWFCSFCNHYNQVGEVPKADSFLVDAGYASGQPRTVVIIDINTTFPEDLEVLKEIDYCELGSLCLITIQDGSVIVRGGKENTIVKADSNKVNNHLKKFDSLWFVNTFRLMQDNIWINSEQFQHAVKSLNISVSPSKKRCGRHTALAFFVASCLSPRQVIAFIMGPSTMAPGKVISIDRKNHIRQHRNIEEGKDMKYWKDSKTFYLNLSKYSNFVNITMFISSLDQVGVWEMLPCLKEVIQYESFADFNFRNDWETFVRTRASYNILDIDVFTSNKLLLNGIIGPVKAINSNQRNVSDTLQGEGGSTTFRYRGPLTSRPSLLVSFSVDTSRTIAQAEEEMPEHFVIQLETKFEYKGKMYVHIETKLISTTNSANAVSLSQNYNWEIMAASILKRIAYNSMFRNKYYDIELKRWAIEIIRLIKGLQSIMVPNLEPFQEFSYFLQRSSLLNKRNTSPDEWIMFHRLILTCKVSHAFLCIKPHIYLTDGFLPTKSDIVRYCDPMLVDGGDFLLLRYSPTNDLNLKELRNMAQSIYNGSNRFPKPIYREAMHGSSQDRFLLSRLALVNEHSLPTSDMTLDKYMNNFVNKA